MSERTPYNQKQEAAISLKQGEDTNPTGEFPAITEELVAREKAIQQSRDSAVTTNVATIDTEEQIRDADIISSTPFDEDGPTTVKMTPSTPLSAVISRPTKTSVIPPSGIDKKK